MIVQCQYLNPVSHAQGVCILVEVVLLIDCLHELTYHQGHALYPLNLLLRSNELSLETPTVSLQCKSRKSEVQIVLPLFIFDILFL